MTTEKEKELRLACLELAMSKCNYLSNTEDEILNTAKKFYDFVTCDRIPLEDFFNEECACKNVISKDYNPCTGTWDIKLKDIHKPFKL